ncbi:hypothetical protein SAMN04487979_114115 [Flavobacterium sp. ov086]|nr:hypothetical protein SAMN04487979_114115 [Flavobacterium sp. ov086]
MAKSWHMKFLKTKNSAKSSFNGARFETLKVKKTKETINFGRLFNYSKIINLCSFLVSYIAIL